MSALRYAVRSLARRPLVTLVAVLSLALGIGVNTAIFSAFERIFLRRLPIPEPDRIVSVTSPGPRPGSSSTSDSGGQEAIFSYPLFRDLERLDPAMLMAAHRDFRASLAYRGQTSESEGLLVSGNYFPALGLRPALGRLFGPEDDRTTGGHPEVVLSHRYWQTSFGGDPGIIGAALVVNGEPMTVVGVAPEGFSGTTALDDPDVFVPLMMAERAYNQPGWNGLSARSNHWLYVFARLGDGVSQKEAQSRLEPGFAALIQGVELPALRANMSETTRRQFAERRVVLKDGSGQRMSDRRQLTSMFAILFVVTGLVLAIACANVANLLLVRASDRSTEVAIRRSMGASNGQLLRLFLLESCLLGGLGATAAVVVARITLDGLLAMLPPTDGGTLGFQINLTVWLFAMGLGIGASLVFGLLPAIHGMRGDPGRALHAASSRSTASRATGRVRTSLATTQIALATALLVVAGLFVASLLNLSRVELGIRRDGLIAFRVSPFLNGYGPEQARSLFSRLDDELQSIPGVISVTASTVPILSNSNWNNNITVEGFSAEPDADVRVSVAQTSTSYFPTLGIPLLAGRDFTDTDLVGSPKVAIVNEAFARKFNLGAHVIGTRMAMGTGNGITLDIQIVGLVRDAKYSEVRQPAPPQMFTPYRQTENVGTLTYYLRTSTDARAVLTAIAPAVARLDPTLPVVNARTMDEQIRENTTPDRVLTTLSSSFAALATLLAAIGLYAVLAYGVAQRVREIGLRMALGASRLDVGRLVLTQVGRITLIGVSVGAGLALGLGRLGQSMLYGVQSGDVTVFGVAVALVVAVALAAGMLPAYQASRVDPAHSLRAE